MKGMKKRVLVTGSGGFVGSHLVEHLIDHGYQVRCFLRYTSRTNYGWLEDLPKGKKEKLEIVAGDIRDADAVSKSIENIDIIFHLAALVGIPYSYIHPREVIETNLMGTFNVLMAGRAKNVKRTIHISTSEVYGTAQYVPIDEDHILQGQSPYAASKIAAEKLVESFYATYGLPATVIRPFNIYGPRQSARAVIPTIIAQIIESSEVRLGNITPTRDFTYVSDTVRAFIKAAECDLAIGETLNVGSNFEISIADLVEKIAGLLNKKVRIIQEAERDRPQKSEVQRLWADNARAYQILNWRPLISLDKGLEKTAKWIEMNIDQFRAEKYEI